MLEVLVALTILCLSASALFGVFSHLMELSRQEEWAAQARILVQSLLARERASLSRADQQGVTPAGLVWRVQVAKASGSADGQPFLQPAAVTIGASWPAGKARRQLSIHTLLFAPPQSTP